MRKISLGVMVLVMAGACSNSRPAGNPDEAGDQMAPNGLVKFFASSGSGRNRGSGQVGRLSSGRPRACRICSGCGTVASLRLGFARVLPVCGSSQSLQSFSWLAVSRPFVRSNDIDLPRPGDLESSQDSNGPAHLTHSRETVHEAHEQGAFCNRGNYPVQQSASTISRAVLLRCEYDQLVHMFWRKMRILGVVA